MKIKKHLNFTSLHRKTLEIFKSIPDWRQKSKVTTSIPHAIMRSLACMYFQDPSLLQFQISIQEKQHRNNLNTLFGGEEIPKESQRREITDVLIAIIFALFLGITITFATKRKASRTISNFPRPILFPRGSIEELLTSGIIRHR